MHLLLFYSVLEYTNLKWHLSKSRPSQTSRDEKMHNLPRLALTEGETSGLLGVCKIPYPGRGLGQDLCLI